MGDVLVVGVGNELRGDDGAGLVAARRVGAAAGGVDVLESRGDAAALVEAWAGRESVTVIDAVRSGRPPGEVVRLDAAAGPLPVAFGRSSTHEGGVAAAVELGRALGRLPRRLVVFGIEAAAFGPGPGLSAAARRGAEEAADRVLAEIGELTGEVRHA